MCYMGDLERVGIRELRQNLTRYLRRVAEGRTLRVTDRGRPVALLGPLPEESDALGRAVAAGRLFPARLDLHELGAPEERPMIRSISEALTEQREE